MKTFMVKGIKVTIDKDKVIVNSKDENEIKMVLDYLRKEGWINDDWTGVPVLA